MTGTVRAIGGLGRGPRVPTGPLGRELDAVWGVLLLVSAALTMAAIATVLPGWLSPRLGNPDWEFVALADVAAVLPLFALGMGGLLVVAAGQEREGLSLGVGIGFALLGLVLVACLLVFATTAVIAVRNTQVAPLPIAVGVKRVVARTLWSQLVGIVGCAAAAVASFRIHLAARNQTRA